MTYFSAKFSKSRLPKILGVAAIVGTAFAAANTARASDFINILTGGTSGVYYPMGVAMSKLFGDKIAASRPSVQATKASVENLNLLQTSKGEIAFTLGDSLIQAWEGNTDAGFTAPQKRLRGIAAIYPNYVQIVASKSSGIKTLADLKGKRLSVGAPKSGTELSARAILAAAGMTYADLGKVEYLSFGASVELMKNRQLDATLQSAGLGVASIRDLSTSVEIVMVEIPDAVIQKAGPPFVAGAIPAKTYTGQDVDVKTAAVMNFLVTHEGAPEKLVYEMTKAVFDNLPELASAHSAGKAITLKGALDGMAIPLHPGAAKYFREKGLAVTN
jgi:TRAP transporter TAXI family solute receptor